MGHCASTAGKKLIQVLTSDIRGSVTTIVDGTGAVVKRYDYDEFRRDGQHVIYGNIV